MPPGALRTHTFPPDQHKQARYKHMLTPTLPPRPHAACNSFNGGSLELASEVHKQPRNCFRHPACFAGVLCCFPASDFAHHRLALLCIFAGGLVECRQAAPDTLARALPSSIRCIPPGWALGSHPHEPPFATVLLECTLYIYVETARLVRSPARCVFRAKK